MDIKMMVDTLNTVKKFKAVLKYKKEIIHLSLLTFNFLVLKNYTSDANSTIMRIFNKYSIIGNGEDNITDNMVEELKEHLKFDNKFNSEIISDLLQKYDINSDDETIKGLIDYFYTDEIKDLYSILLSTVYFRGMYQYFRKSNLVIRENTNIESIIKGIIEKQKESINIIFELFDVEI